MFDFTLGLVGFGGREDAAVGSVKGTVDWTTTRFLPLIGITVMSMIGVRFVTNLTGALCSGLSAKLCWGASGVGGRRSVVGVESGFTVGMKKDFGRGDY